MKNTFNFNLGSINLTIEGTPISIENFNMEYTNEASVQELATSANFIKDLVNEIKDVVKEAQQQYNNCNITSVPVPKPITTSTPDKPNTTAVAPKKIEQTWDLPAIWEVMMSKKPEGFTKTGIGCYTFKTGTITDKNKIKVNIEFNEDSIDMDIYMGSSAIHGYLYSDGKRSRITGINPALMNDMIKEMPNEIEEFVKNYFDKIIK